MVSKGLSNESLWRNFRVGRLPPYKCLYRLGLDSYWNRAGTEQKPSRNRARRQENGMFGDGK